MSAAPMRLWRVTIKPHRVVGPAKSYDLAAMETVVSAQTPERARLDGIRRLHVREELPSWRPYVRESWPFASAVPEASAVEKFAAKR